MCENQDHFLDNVTKGKNQPCVSAKRCIVCNLLHCECEDGPLSLDDLVDVLQDVISQSCWDDERKVYDSMALSVYADGLRTLAKFKRIQIEDEVGRRVIAKGIK